MTRARGFTLIEVVVTAAILSVVMVMFATFMSSFGRSLEDRRKETVTARDARRAMERMAESLRSAVVNFTGEGTATISFQVPVDDGSGTLKWGARRSSQDIVGEATVYRFTATGTFSEAARKIDLNRDGDEDDTFDVGHVEQVHFATTDTMVLPVRPPVVFSPDFVLQIQGSEIGDITGDGNGDPMFSWDGVGLLRITLFVTDLDPKRPSFVRMSTVVELRNKML